MISKKSSFIIFILTLTLFLSPIFTMAQAKSDSDNKKEERWLQETIASRC